MEVMAVLLLHLQEVPVDQRLLEPRFYLEDPKRNKNLSKRSPELYLLVQTILLKQASEKRASPWTRGAQVFPLGHLDQGGPEKITKTNLRGQRSELL